MPEKKLDTQHYFRVYYSTITNSWEIDNSTTQTIWDNNTQEWRFAQTEFEQELDSHAEILLAKVLDFANQMMEKNASKETE